MIKSIFYVTLAVLSLICLPATASFSQGGWEETLRQNQDMVLYGTVKGLYAGNRPGNAIPVWTGGEVKKIVSTPYGIFLLTEKGVLFTDNLRDFDTRNEGLTFKTVKWFRNGEKGLTNVVQDLKDLKADPVNPSNLVTCSKDGVFFSGNAGAKWSFHPNPTIAPGIKSVAVVTYPDTVLFLAHPFRGVFMKNITKKGPWTDISKGVHEATQAYEEISDLLAVRDGNAVQVFAANNFTPNLYRYNRKTLSWTNICRYPEKFGIIESLNYREGSLFFVSSNGVMKYDRTGTFKDPEAEGFLSGFPSNRYGDLLSCLSFRSGKVRYNLSELWVTTPVQTRETVRIASGRKGLYVQPYFLKNAVHSSSLLSMMEKAGLDALVIDMKDDWGNLRFDPQSPLLKKMGHVGNTLDLESFTKEMKERNIYLVARLVLFQDRVIYQYDNFAYSAKDGKGSPWQGTKKAKGGGTKLIQEYWVDPYCEKVWEYNIEIAKELVRRGFDEIQFDYVRFPTDGDNLPDVTFRYRDRGMDKESAILSFLMYARENISAPISIDIYGANGWWRTSARTGQDVEMFKYYVDVICPMFYPSHFDPVFEYYPPVDKRTYRIYHYGSLRNFYFGRKSVVVRPYVQVFKMNYLKYDREFYGPGYVKNQIDGVDDSINQGYTFWNMGVKYQVLSNVFRISPGQSPVK